MIAYLIESTVVLTLLYLLFHIVIKKGKDFYLQRIYLVSMVITASILPLLKIPLPADPILPSRQILLFEESLYEFTSQLKGSFFMNSSAWDPLQTIWILYLTGVSVFLFRFIYYLFKPFKHIRKYGIIKRGKLKLIYTDNIHSPFSIFNFIFIDQARFTGGSLEKVIAHEEVHVFQKHTVDLLLAELFLTLQWFNPAAYLLKRSIREVHEYLADEGVLQKGYDRTAYARFILRHLSINQAAGLVSQFNSIIKKRLIMMSKNNSNKITRFRFILILPVIAMLMMAFSFEREARVSNTPGLFISPFRTNYPGFQESNVPSIWPVENEKCRFTSGFGMRIHPIQKVKKLHKGVDLAAEKGTVVMATANGTVEKTEYWKEGYGNYIIIIHDDVYTTLYAQLSEMKVNPGDKVREGQVIGLVGSSGLSTAPHLHYEVRKNGDAVDPADYFQSE